MVEAMQIPCAGDGKIVLLRQKLERVERTL